MRLVHISDLHLGFRQYHRLTHSSINQREADVAKAFRTRDRSDHRARAGCHPVRGGHFSHGPPDEPGDHLRVQPARPPARARCPTRSSSWSRATTTARARRRRGASCSCSASLGVHVVDGEPRRLSFPERDLSILAVPDNRPATTRRSCPSPALGTTCSLLHGEVQGMLPPQRDARRSRGDGDPARRDRPAAVELRRARPLPRVPPDGAERVLLRLDSTTRAPTRGASSMEEREIGLPGKGFIEFDLERGVHTFHPIDAAADVRGPAGDLRARAVGGGARRARFGTGSTGARAASRTRSCVWSCATFRVTSRASSITSAARVQAPRAALSPRHPPARRHAHRPRAARPAGVRRLRETVESYLGKRVARRRASIATRWCELGHVATWSRRTPPRASPPRAPRSALG